MPSRLRQNVGGRARREPSPRAEARARYRVAAAADAGLAAPAPPPAQATRLHERARRLYEAGTVPVREVARLAEVCERTLYKWAEREGWRRRHRRPARGAGGRFVRAEAAGRPHPRGLGAVDPKRAARAERRCRRAEALARKIAAEAAASALRRAQLAEAARAFALSRSLLREAERAAERRRRAQQADERAHEELFRTLAAIAKLQREAGPAMRAALEATLAQMLALFDARLEAAERAAAARGEAAGPALHILGSLRALRAGLDPRPALAGEGAPASAAAPQARADEDAALAERRAELGRRLDALVARNESGIDSC